jgi:methylphosphotriester-DNA--protein-cysteine methyltransferase
MFYEAGVRRASGFNSALNRGLCETPQLRQPPDWRVERILRFVNTQDGKLGWGLNHLCAQLDLGISASHAAKLFSRHIGIGIREYAKQQRLKLAARQLQNTTHSVKHIALELGYRTPNDLRRQFAKLFCLSPTQFRTAYRQAIIPKRPGMSDLPANVSRFGGGKA